MYFPKLIFWFTSVLRYFAHVLSLHLQKSPYPWAQNHTRRGTCIFIIVRRAKFSFIERLNSSLFQFQSNLLKSAQILNGRERNSTVPSETLHNSLIKCTSYCEFGLLVLVVPFLLRGGQRQIMPPCRWKELKPVKNWVIKASSLFFLFESWMETSRLLQK